MRLGATLKKRSQDIERLRLHRGTSFGRRELQLRMAVQAAEI